MSVKDEGDKKTRTLHVLTMKRSYFVTELLGTDLHRLLQARPLEKQFIQYFLYQILVSQKRKKKSMIS